MGGEVGNPRFREPLSRRDWATAVIRSNLLDCGAEDPFRVHYLNGIVVV